MRLVACSNCRTQYDVSQIVDAEISCRCGEKIENRALEGVDAKIHRCGSCGAQVGAEAASCEYCASEIVRDTRKLSLICPECYARNAEASRYCTACGVGFRPEALEVEGHELPCPDCTCLMPPRAIGGVGINECPQCNGLWVPDHRFDHLISQACEAARNAGLGSSTGADRGQSRVNAFSTKVVYRKCPECDGHMQRTNFQKKSGVIVDHCHEHGTWLDADELEQIAEYILKGGLGQGGYEEYAVKAQINAKVRREAAALARAMKGETITITSSREHGSKGGFLGMLLKELLD